MSGPHRVAFGILFFSSGALALVYEVLWQRSLSLRFGVTGFAIAVILAAYMCGLALGTALGGRLAPRLRRPAAVYGVFEIAIGVAALALPTLMEMSAGIYRWVYLTYSPGPVAFGLVQGVILLGVLLIPTTLMGATFPLLIQAVVPADRDAGSRVGWLYTANCSGAVLGTLAAGFVFLPELGHRATTGLAVAGSILVGALAIILSWAARSADWAAVVELEPPAPPPIPPNAPTERWLLLAVASTGAAAMIYEVAWSRLLALQMGSSVYAFTTMLATFLAGLAIGGSAAAAILRVRPASGTRGFAISQALALAGVGFGSLLFPHLPPTYVRLYHIMGAGGTAFGVQVILAAMVMLPAAIAMGASLPFAMAVVGGGKASVTTPVARLYVANTLGSVVGTLAAGFGLLPWLGVAGTIQLGMAVAAVGLLAVVIPPGGGVTRLGWLGGVAAFALGLAVLTPKWDPLLMAAGLYKHVEDLEDADRDEIVGYAHRNLELLYYGEGLSSAVTVGRSQSSGSIWLANNGKVDASSVGDLPTQLMLAHMPMATHPAPKDVLVIGLASGITLGGITRYPAEHIDVLEIEAHIIEASHFFDEHNDRPLEDPRVNVHIADARNHLVLSEARYDVIVSEPSNPWIAGVNNLFTHEFFELVDARLKPGGILCQWIQIYELSPRDLTVLLRTFHGVFDEVILYWSVDDGDLLVVGGNDGLSFDPQRLERLLADERIAASLARIDVTSIADWLSWYHTGTEGVQQMIAEGGGLNTDDNAFIEFRAPLFLGLDTSNANSRELLSYRSGPESLLMHRADDPALHEALAGAYLKRNLFGLSRAAMRRFVEAGGDLEIYFAFMDQIDEAYDNHPYVDPTSE